MVIFARPGGEPHRMHLFICNLLATFACMNENKHTLNEPAGAYGGKTVSIEEMQFAPMSDMKSSLKSKGYITHEELVDRLNKYL